MLAKRLITQWASSTAGQSPLIIVHASQTDPQVVIHEVAVSMFGTDKLTNNPDIIMWQPAKATITIKEIRGLLDQLIRTPFNTQRLVVLTNVEKLSQPAANALLKSLEEPSATTKWLLLTAYPRQLLPTIRSRCQLIRLPGIRGDVRQSDPADESLDQIFARLSQLLEQQGPTADIRRGYLRLRDFYMIRSRRGNTKLAREILELSVPFKI